jgi:hypothetical protein
MHGLTRATTTLIGAGVAGLLLWLATQISNDHIGGYWARIGLVAGAGLVMALSQLLGGWTKWGWPRLSVPVLFTAFLPVAFVSLWIVLAGEPSNGWFHTHVLEWTRDIHVSGLVTDLLFYIPVLAFGTGLVFGFSLDTTGPVVRDRDVVATAEPRRGLFGRRRAETTTTATTGRAADEPLTAERESVPIAPTRTDERETVTTTTHRTDEDRRSDEDRG